MGAFLDKPRTEKETFTGSGNGLHFAVSAMQGWRVEMEDAHASVVSCLSKGLKDWSFFGVFDGHAGSDVSKYCADNLLDSIIANSGLVSAIQSKSDNTEELVNEAIRNGFISLDEDMRKHPKWKNGDDKSGSTAVVLFVTPTHLYFGNCGDSRGVLSRNKEAVFCTIDHKPGNPEERSRIEKAGGSVMIQRVNGSLAVSRALGDFEYKLDPDIPLTEQLVSPEPEISSLTRDIKNDEFVVLACDGVWDVMPNEGAVDYIHSRLQITDDLKQVCSQLIDTCLAKGSRDNMSVIIITFPGAPKISQDAIKKMRVLLYSDERPASKMSEEELDSTIERKIKELIDSNDPADVDLPFVMQQLNGMSLDNLPPGGGLPAKKTFVEKVLEKHNVRTEHRAYDGLLRSSKIPRNSPSTEACSQNESFDEGVM